MRRSRLRLFKTTSLTISLIGIVLIVVTVGIVAYIGVSELTSSVSNTVSSGTSYDQLSSVKSEYNSELQKYNSINTQVVNTDDMSIKSDYNNGKLKLSEANQTISSAESDISDGKSDKEVETKINQTKQSIKEANNIYNDISGSIG